MLLLYESCRLCDQYNNMFRGYVSAVDAACPVAGLLLVDIGAIASLVLIVLYGNPSKWHSRSLIHSIPYTLVVAI